MKITYKGVTKDLKYYKGLKWDKPLTSEMEAYEKETGKNAIYRGVVTGSFEYWLYWRKSKKPSKPRTPKPTKRKSHTKQPTKTHYKSRTQKHKIIDEEKLFKQMRRGNPRKPIIEKIRLNKANIAYNWTEGQLYVNDEKIGEPDSIYARDLFKYSKIHSPHISVDGLYTHLIYNYDKAKKQNWNKTAIMIQEYGKLMGVKIE